MLTRQIVFAHPATITPAGAAHYRHYYFRYLHSRVLEDARTTLDGDIRVFLYLFILFCKHKHENGNNIKLESFTCIRNDIRKGKKKKKRKKKIVHAVLRVVRARPCRRGRRRENIQLRRPL